MALPSAAVFAATYPERTGGLVSVVADLGRWSVARTERAIREQADRMSQQLGHARRWLATIAR